MEKLSFENTKRLLDRDLKVQHMLNDMVMEGIRESDKILRSEVNKTLYDLAEKRGVSLWDLCFHVVPRVKTDTPTFADVTKYADVTNFQPSCTVKYGIVLEPLEFEFEKGPGYWKGKYYALKDKMRSVLDSKDDEED